MEGIGALKSSILSRQGVCFQKQIEETHGNFGVKYGLKEKAEPGLLTLMRACFATRNLTLTSVYFLATASIYLLVGTSAVAQVTGTFSPGVYNEPAYGPLPIRREIVNPTAIPLTERARQLYSELKDSRRPYIGSVFAYTNESLVIPDNKLDTVTQGLECGFFPNNQTQVKLNYLPTIFGLSKPVLGGQEFRATVISQPNNRFSYYARVGLFHTFHNVRSGLSVIGGAGASYAVTDRIKLYGSLSRYIIGQSRLSATGLDLFGSNILVGRVKANQLTVGATIRPTIKTELDFQYTIGVYAGHRLISNRFNELNFRVGRTIIAREPSAHISFLQPSYQLLALGFRKDLSAFGNLSLTPSQDAAINVARLISSSLGQISLPQPSNEAGVGGYFSPQLFYLHQFRLDCGGRLFKHVFYDFGGGLATQNFKSASTNLGPTGLVGTANVSIIAKINKHITLEQGWYFLQAANTYRRYVLYNQSRYYF